MFRTYKNTFSFFLPYLTLEPRFKRRIVFALLLMGVDIAATALVPIYSKNIVNALSGQVSLQLGLTVLLLGVFWTLEKTCSYIQDIIFFPIPNSAVKNITGKLTEKMHNIACSEYQSISVPEILSAIKRISFSARHFFKIIFLMIVPTFFKIIIVSYTLMQFGLAGVVLLPILLGCMFILYKGTGWYSKKREMAWEQTDLIAKRMNDSFYNTKLVRNHKTFELSALYSLLETEATLWQKVNTSAQAIHIGVSVLMGIIITLASLLMVFSIQQKLFTLGDFVLLKAQILALFLPLKTITLELRQLVEASVDIAKVKSVFEKASQENQIPETNLAQVELTALEQESAAAIMKNPSEKKDYSIHLKNVSFSFPSQTAAAPLLRNISLNIYPQEKILIRGENGSGKSTLAQILSGLLPISEGKIWVEDKARQVFSLSDYTSDIHYVAQDVTLFNLPLQENLHYGQSTLISTKTINEVLHHLNLTHVDLDHFAGEMGNRLSGGEQNRLLLARAILLKPSVLILDETLESIPVEKESAILSFLIQHIPSIILISHRMTSLPFMDRVLYLENGSIKTIHNNYSELIDA